MSWRPRVQCPIWTRCHSHRARVPEKGSLQQAHSILMWTFSAWATQNLSCCFSHWPSLRIFFWFNFPHELGASDPGNSSLIVLSGVGCCRGDRERFLRSRSLEPSIILEREAEAPRRPFYPSLGHFLDPRTSSTGNKKCLHPKAGLCPCPHGLKTVYYFPSWALLSMILFLKIQDHSRLCFFLCYYRKIFLLLVLLLRSDYTMAQMEVW